MLGRCLLDTWDTEYYLLPFVLAVLAWEIRAPVDRAPIVALASSALAWLSFRWLPEHCSADLQSALFLAWSLPLAACSAGVCFANPHGSARAAVQPTSARRRLSQPR